LILFHTAYKKRTAVSDSSSKFFKFEIGHPQFEIFFYCL